MNKVKQEERNHAEFQELCYEMAAEGYEKKEHVFSKTKTTIWGVIIPVGFIVIIGMLYRRVRGVTPDFELSYPVMMVIMVVSMVIHELLHGAGWAISCRQGWKSIEFGLNGIMPYCHCKEALEAGRYLIGVLLPVLVLGAGIFSAAFIFADMWLVLTAVINLLLAGGDLLIAISLRGCMQMRIIDHPTEPGFVAFYKGGR